MGTWDTLIHAVREYWQLLPMYYAENLRGELFTGFLTVGALIYSLKSTIVFSLKDKVYDSPDYIKEIINPAKQIDPNYESYVHLRLLSSLLLKTVIFSFVTAGAQLTLGLLPYGIPVCISIVLALITMTYIFRSLYIYKRNMDQWFKWLKGH